MKTFRNMFYALLILSSIALLMVILFTEERSGVAVTAALSVCEAVFAVSLVAMIASLILYFNAKSCAIVVLKRRGSKAYGELLYHKIRLINVMDEAKSVAEWDDYLYNETEFFRIKKFLYEEYFLLIGYEPFWNKSASTAAVDTFYGMHKELENFMRSVTYDRIEFNKFRRQFQKVHGQDMAPDTPEELFNVPELQEAYAALYSANEYALSNSEHLMDVLDTQLKALDKYFRAGVPWSTTKPNYDAEYQLWMGAK